MQHLVSRVVFCVLLLIETFAVVVFIRNIDQLDFDFSIRFVELLTLGITVFLAWWVAKRLEKGVSEERFEKELLINKLADLDGELKEFKNWIDKGSSFLATLMESKLKEYRSVSSQISSELTCRYDSISKDINKGNSLPLRNLKSYARSYQQTKMITVFAYKRKSTFITVIGLMRLTNR